MTPDPEVQRLRDEISRVDGSILEAVNERVELVARLKAHKLSLGLGFVDPDREREILDGLAAANGGPLSEEGVRDLFREVLALVKREVEAEGRDSA